MTIVDLDWFRPGFRTKFTADLIGAAVAASLVWTSIAAVAADGVDLGTAHLALALVTVAVAGAVTGALLTQTRGHRLWACLSSAVGLHAVLDVALTALGPGMWVEGPLALGVWAAGNVAVTVLLLRWAVDARPAGSWSLSMAGVGAVAVLGETGWHMAGMSPLLDRPVVQAAVALGWASAAVRALAIGLGRRDLPVTRVGLGFALLAFGELCRVGTGASVTEPDLLFNGLRLVGAFAVLGGLVGLVSRHRGEVMSLELEQERQQAALRDAILDVERAAAVAAERDHEIASGLAGLAGIAYLLDRSGAPGDGVELRSAVLEEISRLHNMLARPERQGEDGPFDVSATLSELVVLRSATGMRVDVDARHNLVAARGRGAFAQAVTNLLNNCERHAPGSAVRLRAFETGDCVVVEVRDDGPGVPDGREQQVLERGVTAGATGGSGLGLYVSARLVREQGGDLRVLPRKPQQGGFAVRLELPRNVDRDRGARAAAVQQAA